MDLFQTSDDTNILKYNANELEEKSIKIEKSDYLYSNSTENKEKLYSRRLIQLEYASIILTSASFIIFSILAYEDESVSAFAFAIDSFLDVLSYIIMIWRFGGDSSDALSSHKKDRLALISLGFVFFLSSIGVEYESISNLVSSVKPRQSNTFIILGAVESILFSVMAILKFIISTKVKANKTIISDGINSLIAGFGALSMTVSMTIYTNNSNIWYLDGVFGIAMGLFVLIYGLKLLYDNRK